ncbi:MAG: acetyltransferase [Gammaproteobacteria bacterium]
MFLKHRKTGDMVEILDVDALFDPCKSSVPGRFHAGEEMPEPEVFDKNELTFPSDEKLPRCWLDPHYRSTTR